MHSRASLFCPVDNTARLFNHHQTSKPTTIISIILTTVGQVIIATKFSLQPEFGLPQLASSVPRASSRPCLQRDEENNSSYSIILLLFLSGGYILERYLKHRPIPPPAPCMHGISSSSSHSLSSSSSLRLGSIPASTECPAGIRLTSLSLRRTNIVRRIESLLVLLGPDWTKQMQPSLLFQTVVVIPTGLSWAPPDEDIPSPGAPADHIPNIPVCQELGMTLSSSSAGYGFPNGDPSHRTSTVLHRSGEVLHIFHHLAPAPPHLLPRGCQPFVQPEALLCCIECLRQSGWVCPGCVLSHERVFDCVREKLSQLHLNYLALSLNCVLIRYLSQS
ncbi:unnamed protein product [Acanthosepion pharaonis]|uniref:Uncharacterized protein n=1 Tax=Acanthosepion pharaonis TaxID=158019 RepID=A0A812CFA4_ACAPH|nr:unnamed protein product [Sepia pharaonis]